MSADLPDALARYIASRGLTPGAGGPAERWTGTIDGLALSLAVLEGGSSSARLHATARLPHELDLGLLVEPAGVMASNDGPHATGDADFDGRFVVRAAEGERESVAHLLDPTARGAACELAGAGPLRLTDVALTSVRRLRDGDADWPRHIDATLALARHVAARGAELPAPCVLREHGVAARVGRVALNHELTLVSNALAVRGELAGTDVDVRWRARAHAVADWLEADAYSPALGLRVVARFREPLGAGLALRRATLADDLREWVGKGDVHTGDAAFDGAWTVRALDPSEARGMLHPDARELLAAIAATGLQFALDENALVGHAPWDLAPDALTALFDALSRLRASLRPTSAHSPYR